MKLFLCFTLLIVTFLALDSTVDAGLIRRSRRLRRIGPHRTHGLGERSRSSRVLQRRKWPHFLAPPRKWGRNLRRPKPPQSTEREDRPTHHMRLPLMMAQPSSPMTSWRPLDFGNPIDRDPTFDYAPPALERVRFKGTTENRRRKKPTYRRSENGKPRPSMFGRPRPRPSLWKLLATKQRPRHPFNRRPMPHHPQMKYPNPLSTPSDSDEAEIFPRLPNIVYFRPNDVIPGAPKPFIPQHQIHQLNTILNNNHNRPPLHLLPTFKPGKVTSVPLYSRENTSPSLFNPIAPTSQQQQQQQQQQLKAQIQQVQQSASTPQYVIVPKQPADILYRPQEFMNPTRKPTILQPIKSTPITYSATRNSVIKPVEPTESLLNTDVQKPINSFSILNSVYASNSNSNKKNNHILDNNNNDDKEKDLSDTRKVKTERPRPVFESSVSPAVISTVEEESTTLPVSILTSVSSSTSVHIRGDVSTSSSTTETSTSAKSPVISKSSSISSNRISSTLKPISTTTTTATPETTTTTLSYQKLPQMPKYNRPSPTYPKRITSLNKSPFGSSFNSNVGTSSSKETGGSGEGLVITMARSKVKEYKPQFLANYTQLLTFDKVQEVEPSENDTENEPITSSSLIVNSENLSPPEKSGSSTEIKDSSISTTKSPLQNFDPMKLLHSWFQNT